MEEKKAGSSIWKGYEKLMFLIYANSACAAQIKMNMYLAKYTGG